MNLHSNESQNIEFKKLEISNGINESKSKSLEITQ